MMKNNENLVERAKVFAEKAHRERFKEKPGFPHLRKYTKEPYVVHTQEVAEMLRGMGFSDEAVAAAHLHDVLEDTFTTFEDLENEFGRRVADLVNQVTDVSMLPENKKFNRRTRKEMDRQHLSKGDYEGQSIKLADLISNTKTIVEFDKDFAVVYLKEKEKVLEVLTVGDSTLKKLAQERLVAGKEALRQHNERN